MSEHSIDVVPGLVRGHKRDGRCVYDRQAKRELVRRCQEPGVSVAGMALAHGINANLLRKWITLGVRRRRGEDLPAPVLLPVTTQPEGVAKKAPEGHLELVLSGGLIRVCGRVEAEALRVVIDCLSRHA